VRVPLGLAHVPEGRWLFPEMSVEENLKLGAFTLRERNTLQSRLAYVYELFPRLWERRSQIASTMSGGEQQMTAIGRALMSKPKLLILDEPSLGLAPIVVKDILEIMRTVRDAGVSVLVVEQNVRDVLPISDMAFVLENGNVLASGPGAALMDDARVQEAYLGHA
jgi:branched-chain amino acid transport system ATP-binding protein